MSRKLLRAVSASVAGAALVVGPMAGAGAGAGAQAGQPALPVLIGDPGLQTYATFSEVSTWQDPYVRMLPPEGSTANAWEFLDSTAGGTAIVHIDTGGCLQPDLDGAQQWVVVAGCERDANESWEVQSTEKGTVFVHVQTGACLTHPSAGDDDGGTSQAPKGLGDGFDPRLSLAACDRSQEQYFSLVV